MEEVLRELDGLIAVKDEVEAQYPEAKKQGFHLSRESILEIRNAVKNGVSFMDAYNRLWLRRQKEAEQWPPDMTWLQWLYIMLLMMLGSLLGSFIMGIISLVMA
jgi:hypothetical protein